MSKLALDVTGKKKLEESNLTQLQARFYDESNHEIQEGNKSTVEYYVSCVKKALAYADDRTCALTFVADMMRDERTAKILQNGPGPTIIFMLQGNALREYLVGFTVLGITRFELTRVATSTPITYAYNTAAAAVSSTTIASTTVTTVTVERP